MKREEDTTIRCHVKMFTEDWEWINDHFGTTIGASKFIRTVVRAYIKQFRAQQEEGNVAAATIPIQIPIE